MLSVDGHNLHKAINALATDQNSPVVFTKYTQYLYSFVYEKYFLVPYVHYIIHIFFQIC